MKPGDKVRVIANEGSNYIQKGAIGTIICINAFDCKIHYEQNGDRNGNQIPMERTDDIDAHNNCYFTSKERLKLISINWREIIK